MGRRTCYSKGIKDDRLEDLETGIYFFKLFLEGWKHLCFSMRNKSSSTTITAQGSQLMRSGQKDK